MTLYELREKVNSETHNQARFGRAEYTGDGVSTMYDITPPSRQIVNDGSLICLVNGVAGVGSMDYTTGVYTFDSAPANGDKLTWAFFYVYWTETQVDMAINSGIQACFPQFWVKRTEDITTDGETKEFTLTMDGLDTVIKLDFLSSAATTSSIYAINGRMEQYGDDIQFYSAPGDGTMTVTGACRPALLEDIQDEMEIPDRASSAVVSYACYQLLTQKQIPRSYSDIVINNLGVGTLSPRQMNDAANAFMMRFQLQVEHTRQRPWRIR